MRARNPVILNGLHQDMMRKNDLLDRALIVTLRRISQAENKSEEKVRADFAAALPVVLAGLLNMVAHGLGRLSSVSHEGAQTRLADFERWSNACESSCGGKGPLTGPIWECVRSPSPSCRCARLCRAP